MFCHVVNCLACNLAGESFLKQECRQGWDGCEGTLWGSAWRAEKIWQTGKGLDLMFIEWPVECMAVTESSQTTEGSWRTLDMNEDRIFPLLTLLLCILGCSDACFLLGIKNWNYFLNFFVLYVCLYKPPSFKNRFLCLVFFFVERSTSFILVQSYILCLHPDLKVNRTADRWGVSASQSDARMCINFPLCWRRAIPTHFRGVKLVCWGKEHHDLFLSVSCGCVWWFECETKLEIAQKILI